MIEPIVLHYQDKTITLLPTAHVSKDSADMVLNKINEINPDAICIELDQSRYQSLKDPEKYRETDIIKIIKEKKVVLMLVNLILSNYQRRMASKLDSKSGMEMLHGINMSEQLNVPLVLADRSIQTTFKRIWANLDFKDKVKLIGMLLSSVVDDEEVSEEDIANLQQSDMLQSALNEVSKAFPHITEVLVDERDKYLTYKIRTAPGKNIVAILGAAHTIGIQKYINDEIDIEKYDYVPPKKLSSKLMGWLIPVIIVAIILTSFSLDANVGLTQIKTWILFNGTLSALGTLIGGGHPLAILVAFLAAPITSLNPLLAAGWFAGLAQAYLTKPTVKDFDNLAVDLNTVKGFWHNKVTRVMLIVVFANLGSTLGTFVSGLNIFKSLIDIL